MKKILLSFSLIISFSAANAQWTEQASNFTAESTGINEIHILDANNVWALAYDGQPISATHPATLNYQLFTKTTDGGANWNRGFIEMGDPDLAVNNICPISATTAWVSSLVPANGFGSIFKTIDGGANWDQQNTGAFQTVGSSFINGVHFFNENVGVAYGDPVGNRFEIWRTIDGGDNWTQLAAANSPVILSGEFGYNNTPIVAGGTIWFTTSKGRLFRSTDMGATWAVSQVSIADFGGINVSGTTGTVIFSDANNGYILKAVGTTYTYSTTVNGGANWSTFVPFTGTRRIINYVPGTNVIVATSLASPYGTAVSSNNGASWTDIEVGSTTQRGASAFLNMTTGWCGGFSTDEITGGIFKLTGQLGTNSFATAKFKLYPNPATSSITISAADVDSYNLSVTDLTGKTVMTKSLNGMENTLDISALATGAYFFELSSDNKKEVVKILKN